MTTETSSRLSRRGMLAGLGAAFAAAGALAAPALNLSWTRKPAARGSWWDRTSASLSHAGADEWSRHVGSEFSFDGGGVAKLVKVEPFATKGARPAELRDRAFALVFDAAKGSLPAGDRMYDVSHPDGGDMKIYFSDCGTQCSGRRLQAIFN
jgi:hypothetical protein